MKTITIEEIERDGLSALDGLLTQGAVRVLDRGRPHYVVMSEATYTRLTQRRGLWSWLDRPTRATRSKRQIDAQLRSEREAWRSRK